MALWKGSVPTIARCMASNLGTFTTYEESKQRLSLFLPKNVAWFISATLAGTMAAALSLPFDNAKTKIQRMKPIDGIYPYKNIFDAMR